MPAKERWVPEAPGRPGLYAARDGLMRPGSLSTTPAISTFDIDEARQFETREECEAWIRAHPVPVFEARGHQWLPPPGT